jgi:DMSO reductase anchor subunit
MKVYNLCHLNNRDGEMIMYHTIFFVLASVSIGFVLYLFFYWRQMHAIVDFENGVLDAPHILLILAVVGFILSFF